MVGPLIAVRRPRDVDRAAIEQQRRALVVGARVERDVVLRVAAVAGADDVAWMTVGLPGRSLPVRMSRAWSRCTKVPFSFVRVTK